MVAIGELEVNKLFLTSYYFRCVCVCVFGISAPLSFSSVLASCFDFWAVAKTQSKTQTKVFFSNQHGRSLEYSKPPSRPNIFECWDPLISMIFIEFRGTLVPIDSRTCRLFLWMYGKALIWYLFAVKIQVLKLRDLFGKICTKVVLVYLVLFLFEGGFLLLTNHRESVVQLCNSLDVAGRPNVCSEYVGGLFDCCRYS